MNKILKFELEPKSVKIKELLHKDFLELEMKAISSAKPNLNGSHFTKESMEEALPTFYNKPVLGSFSVDLDDFRAHEGELAYDAELDNMYYDYTDCKSETPLGVIRDSDKVEIYQDSKDGLYWIRFSCVLWVKYNYKQVKKLLKSKNGHKKISVEVDVLESHYEGEIEVIDKFVFDGVTILGDKYGTGIAEADATIPSWFDNLVYQKKEKCLSFAYKEYDQISEEPSSENNMQGREANMLTYEQKRQILETYLSSSGHPDCWVVDIDDEFVYYCDVSDKSMGIQYREKYTMLEDAEGNYSVEFDPDSKERVIRSWKTYSLESENETVATEETNAESFSDSQVDESSKETGAIETTKEFKCANSNDPEKCSGNCAECEFKDADDNQTCATCGQTEGNNKDCEACGTDKSSFAADLNAEPTLDPAITVDEGLEAATASIQAPEIQHDAENVGDANVEVSANVDGTVVEAIIPTEERDPAIDVTTIVEEPLQPEDKAKENIFSSEETSATEDIQANDEPVVNSTENFSVTIGDITYSLDELVSAFTTMSDRCSELEASLKEYKFAEIIAAASELIEADEVVETEMKSNYVSKITEKVYSGNIEDTESAIACAKEMLAMYYYENRSNIAKSQKDFSISIEEESNVEQPLTGCAKLRDSINKLKYIQNKEDL